MTGAVLPGPRTRAASQLELEKENITETPSKTPTSVRAHEFGYLLTNHRQQ